MIDSNTLTLCSFQSVLKVFAKRWNAIFLRISVIQLKPLEKGSKVWGAMGKKSPALTLDDLWDLEDKFTAMVGSPTGAKLAPVGKVAKRPAALQKGAGTASIKKVVNSAASRSRVS